MAIIQILICGLLILLCLTGLVGLFFFREYVQKISCLSVAYSNFLMLVVFIAARSVNFNEVLLVLVSVLVVFAVNLLIGISLVKNIAVFEQKTADS